MKGIAPLLLACLTGCGSASPGDSFDPRSRLVVLDPEVSPLASDRTDPVLSPPKVFAVWVPSHVDRERDLMIGEHWLFFKLTESGWFRGPDEDSTLPTPKGEATEQDLAPLRALRGFEKAVVPWRRTP